MTNEMVHQGALGELGREKDTKLAFDANAPQILREQALARLGIEGVVIPLISAIPKNTQK